MMKRLLILGLVTLTLLIGASAEEVIPPAYPVPDYVTWLLEVASEEVGYREGDHGYTKYGEWSGDPYAQWCAEFLCWSVDQVDQRHGTALLKNVYPLYSGQNVGKNWFIREGRYITRNGNLEDWGYQWLKGESSFLTNGGYIPQPGDWMFFTWTSGSDTDHVALVEYCTREKGGKISVHVIEGNNPASVQRNTYALTNSKILGYGTVHDAADWTMRSGNSGKKVRELQEKLAYLGYLSADHADGRYGTATVDAVKAYQTAHGLRALGIANLETQAALSEEYRYRRYSDPNAWQINDDSEDEDDPLFFD